MAGRSSVATQVVDQPWRLRPPISDKALASPPTRPYHEGSEEEPHGRTRMLLDELATQRGDPRFIEHWAKGSGR
jgi:hypothetical protein